MEALYAHGSCNVRPRMIVDKLEVLIFEVEYALDVWVYEHLWQRARLTAELETGVLQVFKVQVGIAGSVDKLTGLEPCDLCHHHCQ